MPNTHAMRAANAALDAENQLSDNDASDREDYDEATEQSPVRAPEPVPAPERAGASARMDTETFLACIMESFARMQAETNRSLVETLRSLPYNGGPWHSPPPASTPTPNTSTSSTAGNFAKCTARFNGASREPEVVEAFIDAVQVFKECADVSDDHALRGLPMLLEGDAAVWWRGARTTVITWKDAVARLRAMYGTQQPAYKILREVFSKEQKDERAEVFMCKVRSLIIKLPYEVPIPMQIDIIYGLLHRRVRKRLRRDEIVDIDSFVEKARVIEDTISELAVSTTSTYTAKSSVSSAGTANVSRPQVSRDRELEKTERTPTIGPSVTTDAKVTFNSNENSKGEKRVRCSFCKFYGHSVADCRNLENKRAENTSPDFGKSSSNSHNPIRCYGCGQPGVVRSKCEHCSGKSVPPKSCDFNIMTDDDVTTAPRVSSHPTVSVNSANRVGCVIFDTGANCSVAGSLLYNILVSEGVHFCEAERTIGLADGSRRLKRVLIATVPVFLEGKQVDTEFIVLPGENTKTLLGRDFIAKAGVTLDLAQESWYFSDDPNQMFPFVRSVLLNKSEPMRADVSDVSLRDDEGNKLPPEHRDALNDLFLTIMDFPSRTPSDVRDNQLKDPEVRKIIDAIDSDDPFRGRARADNWYVMADGILYRYGPENEEKDNVVASITPYLRKLSVVLLKARDVNERAQVSQKKYADDKRRPEPDYQVGDLVLLKTQGSNDTGKGQTPKFIPRRDGPYRVKEVIGLTSCALERISNGVSLGNYHVSLLTPFVGSVQAPLRKKRKRERRRKANPAAGAQCLG